MIRYQVKKAEDKKPSANKDLKALERLIEKTKPGWLARAVERIKKIKKEKKYKESSGIWSEISSVYREIQYKKCGFCERLIREDGGELEHFRPKGNVREWPSENDQRTLDALAHLEDFETGGSMEKGYYTLAYAPLNYSMACSHCNSILKRCYFPIAGRRKKRPGQNPAAYAVEKPYLIYPLGVLDDNPEELIEFKGFLPYPVARNEDEHNHRRALVTILLFKLSTDSTLLFERAILIRCLFEDLEKAKAGDADAEKGVSRWKSAWSPYTNCAKSFSRLY
ncbi:MAG: hypothetical protein QNK37_29780 [Acidobacteriota bacterium]|nr:hypothetical protein [Acidobacteriota bacterium]